MAKSTRHQVDRRGFLKNAAVGAAAIVATPFRAVNQGPDGALYVLTDGAGGKILRLKK